jgi:hypothetical protein
MISNYEIFIQDKWNNCQPKLRVWHRRKHGTIRHSKSETTQRVAVYAPLDAQKDGSQDSSATMRLFEMPHRQGKQKYNMRQTYLYSWGIGSIFAAM